MLRTQVVKLARASAAPSIRRSFSISAIRAAEGDTGGMRSGGSAQADSFTKREQASENKFIKEKEMESLKRLREKLQQQRKHLDELDKHIQELEGEGGEHPQHIREK
ncbi:ATPase inhibitor [Cladophialophora chaetospira]|uniref:ATPase inhibitor, mitochondrial n=1 Tax=Cladophialophora chaetospira TaxID=386627 RepID=A0AA38WZS1_9EURO|nr:ATPase inhibitor [Cladophialophora chaetospira]